MVEAIDTQWQVVSRKKGSKAKQKKEQASADSPITFQPREQQSIPGSPSSMSCRSQTSTKVPTETPSSLPESPAMESSWSEASADVVLTSLEESALSASTEADESCSMQENSSYTSLEVVAASESWNARRCEIGTIDNEGIGLFDTAVRRGGSQQTRMSKKLSCAMQRCNEADMSACQWKAEVELRATSSFSAESRWKDQQTQRIRRCNEFAVAHKNRQLRVNHRTETPVTFADIKHDNMGRSSSSSTTERKNITGHIPPIGSAWVHNGHRDETAEWRLVNFQPLWERKSSGVKSNEVHLPVSVQTVDAGRHLVIRKSFLTLEAICDRHRKRGCSLDSCLRGGKC